MNLFERSETTPAWVWISTQGFDVVRADQVCRLRAGLDPSCLTNGVMSGPELWGVYLAVVGGPNDEHLVARAANLSHAENIATALLNKVYTATKLQQSGIVKVNEDEVPVVFEPFTTDTP